MTDGGLPPWCRMRDRVILWLVVYCQSVCLGNEPLETHDQNFIFQLNTCGYSPYVTSSLTRGWVCCLQLLLGFGNIVILRSKSCGSYDHILLFQIWDSPNLEGQVPVFIPHRNRVVQLYPKALDSLFVASFDTQCCGGIWPCLHTEISWMCCLQCT
jgi:hypothetical protein